MTLFALLTASSALADEIEVPLRKTLPVHTGGPRSVLPELCASYENGMLTVDIINYMGDAFITLYDSFGNVKATNASFVEGRSAVEMFVGTLAPGTYTIVVELEDSTYEGIFTIE